jgi:uncharacterized protein (DUF433 family)
MVMPAMAYAHIEITPQGVAILAGTTIKVVEVVMDRLAHHWDADEIQRQHPHLSLAQIYSALAYYYDHQDELDKDIERRLSEAGATLAQVGNTALRAKVQRARLERARGS